VNASSRWNSFSGKNLPAVITSALRDIYRINLGIKKYERVLLFNDRIADNEEPSESDRERRNKLRCLSLLAAEIGKKLCASLTYFEYPATGSHGAEPPEELWELAFGEKAIKALEREHLLSLLLRKKARESGLARAEDIIRKYRSHAVHCVIALSNYSTSHTRFRDFLTRICGCRYASMPLFDVAMLEGAMNIDWKVLAKTTRELAKVLNTADSVRIRTPNGSILSLSTKGRKALSDTGMLTRKGAFGNLPAGEVFLAPVEGSAQGKLVLEWGPTRQLSSPVILTVHDGYVADISGTDDYAAYLRAKLSERRDNGNIAEFGIGTNRAARRPDNILESEKIFGTIHIALGDNSSIGGKVNTPFHQDFVFFRPTVTLFRRDGSSIDILKSGKFV
jgi:leucyl aminopeptidase (aminopeptidase T)